MTPRAATAPPPRAGGGLGLACLLLFGAMLNLTLVVAGLKELVVDRLGGSEADAALFFTVEMAAYVLVGPLWGLASDSSGRRRAFVVGGFAASGLLYLAFLAVGSIPALLVLRFVQGAFAIAGWSTALAVVFDGADDASRARRSGLAGAAMIFGVGAGAPLGGALTHLAGARAPLAAAGLSFLALALAALALADPPRALARPRPRDLLATLAARPRLLVPAGFYLLERFTVGLFVVLFPLHLAASAGAGAARRGLYLALFLFPFALGQLGSYRLTARLGALPTLTAGAALYGAAFAATGAFGPLALAGWMAVLGTLAAVVFPPTLALTAQWSPREARASALAAFNLAGSLGFALGPVAGVAIAGAAGYPGAFAAAGGLVVLAAAAAAWGSRRLSAAAPP